MLRADGTIACDYHADLESAPAACWELVLEPLHSERVLSPSYCCAADLVKAAIEHASYIRVLDPPDASLTIRGIKAVPQAPRPALYIVHPHTKE